MSSLSCKKARGYFIPLINLLLCLVIYYLLPLLPDKPKCCGDDGGFCWGVGPGYWNWNCLHFIQHSTVWISHCYMIHLINPSFTQGVLGGEVHSRLLSILSWITVCIGLQKIEEWKWIQTMWGKRCRNKWKLHCRMLQKLNTQWIRILTFSYIIHV